MNDRKQDALKLLKDPRFFLQNFTKIKGKTPGSLIPFKLNDAQLDLFNAINEHSRIIVLKGRQMGFSTGVVGNFYHRTITNPGTTTALIGYNSELTAELLDKVKTFHRSTPDELRPVLHYNSKYEISFPSIDSKIIVLPSTENVGRGYTLHNCVSARTRVKHETKGFINADEVIEGDRIMDGHGMWNEVIVVQEKTTERDMVVFCTEGCSEILETTDDHKILIWRERPTWVKAKYVQKGDQIAFPDIKDYECYPRMDGYRWSYITRRLESRSDTLVYDFSLKNDPHEFLTSAGIVSNCLATELAFWQKADDKLASLEACVPLDGKLVIESTPSVVGNTFHRIWVSENDYCKKLFPWFWGYSKEEIETIRRRMNNDQKFNREYCCEFDTTGQSVFAKEVIRAQRKNQLSIGDKVKLRGGGEWAVQKRGPLTVYRPPETGGMYVAGADIAEGVSGGNFSAMHMFDRMTGEEVAMYMGFVAPDKFGELLDEWGRYYNNALMAPEINNHGLTTLTIMKQKLYPNLYYRSSKYDTPGQEISDKLGWKTTMITRPILIDDFNTAARDGTIKIHSKALIDQMEVFVYDERLRPCAPSGFHDDNIFAASIAVQAFKILFPGELEQIDYHNYLPRSSSY